MKTGNKASRPIILNRPFRSVGDLGYTFRTCRGKTSISLPPKALIPGLLDLFSIDDGDVTAGRVSLNTRQPLVLQALFSNANKLEESPSSTSVIKGGGSATDAASIAHQITTSSSTSPFMNRADLVNRFTSSAETSSTDSRFTGLPTLAFTARSRQYHQVPTRERHARPGRCDHDPHVELDDRCHCPKRPLPSGSHGPEPIRGRRRTSLLAACGHRPITGQVVDRVLEPVYE